MKKKSCGLFIFLVIFMLAGCQIQKDDYFTENGYFRVECINASQNSTTYNLQQNDILYVESGKAAMRSAKMGNITPWVSVLSVLVSLASLGVVLSNK